MKSTKQPLKDASKDSSKDSSKQTESARWGADTKHVRRALKWIRSKGSITREELIEWDRAHGCRLFTWDEDEAARLGRLWEAGIFLNRFRIKFEGMRVRAFIHVHDDEEAGIEESGYYTVEKIAKHEGMRAQVIKDITQRMAGLAGELKMWKLSDAEQEDLFARVRAGMG